MKLSKTDILNAVRKYNDEKREDKRQLRETITQQMQDYLDKGGTIEKVPGGASTPNPPAYGYGSWGTVLRGSHNY